jgi:hypothetical protein
VWAPRTRARDGPARTVCETTEPVSSQRPDGRANLGEWGRRATARLPEDDESVSVHPRWISSPIRRGRASPARARRRTGSQGHLRASAGGSDGVRPLDGRWALVGPKTSRYQRLSGLRRAVQAGRGVVKNPTTFVLIMRRSGVRFPKAAPPCRRSWPSCWSALRSGRPFHRPPFRAHSVNP